MEAESTPTAMQEDKPRPLKVDIHTHILPRNWPDLAKKYGYGGWVQLEHDAADPVMHYYNWTATVILTCLCC